LTCLKEIAVFATELDLGETAPEAGLIRWELFVFREVRDVLPGPRGGTVVVIHTGAARCEAWLAELHEAGLLADRAGPAAQG
jgi:hypothetical protein